MVEVCYTTACCGQSSLTLTYPTPDSGVTYTKLRLAETETEFVVEAGAR